MLIYGILMGTLCALYYIIITVYTGKPNSTFALFWVAMSILNFLIGLLSGFPEIRLIGLVAIIIWWIIFPMLAFPILIAMIQKKRKGLTVIIVLGAQVKGVSVTDSLRRRLETAHAYLMKNPKTYAILSGGRGVDEDISEASAMADYLHSRGIDESRLILEDKSTSTRENLLFSKLILNSGDDEYSLNSKKSKNVRLSKCVEMGVGVVTNSFHVYRTLLQGELLGYKRLYAIPASSNPVLFLNYLVRECFALINTILRK